MSGFVKLRLQIYLTSPSCHTAKSWGLLQGLRKSNAFHLALSAVPCAAALVSILLIMDWLQWWQKWRGLLLRANPSPITSLKLALATTKLWATLSQRSGINRPYSTNSSFLGMRPMTRRWSTVASSSSSMPLLSWFLERTTGGPRRKIPYSHPSSLVTALKALIERKKGRRYRHSPPVNMQEISQMVAWVMHQPGTDAAPEHK